MPLLDIGRHLSGDAPFTTVGVALAGPGISRWTAAEKLNLDGTDADDVAIGQNLVAGDGSPADQGAVAAFQITDEPAAVCRLT